MQFNSVCFGMQCLLAMKITSCHFLTSFISLYNSVIWFWSYFCFFCQLLTSLHSLWLLDSNTILFSTRSAVCFPFSSIDFYHSNFIHLVSFIFCFLLGSHCIVSHLTEVFCSSDPQKGVSLKLSIFCLDLVRKFKGPRNLVRISESPTFPGHPISLLVYWRTIGKFGWRHTVQNDVIIYLRTRKQAKTVKR